MRNNTQGLAWCYDYVSYVVILYVVIFFLVVILIMYLKCVSLTIIQSWGRAYSPLGCCGSMSSAGPMGWSVTLSVLENIWLVSFFKTKEVCQKNWKCKASYCFNIKWTKAMSCLLSYFFFLFSPEHILYFFPLMLLSIMCAHWTIFIINTIRWTIEVKFINERTKNSCKRTLSTQT